MSEYEFTWGWKYLIYFSYIIEDRHTKIFYTRYKHQIRLHIFSAIIRAYTEGIIFIKDKEVEPKLDSI
jgi:hypothetical protein